MALFLFDALIASKVKTDLFAFCGKPPVRMMAVTPYYYPNGAVALVGNYLFAHEHEIAISRALVGHKLAWYLISG